MGETQTTNGRSGPSWALIALVALLAAGVIGALVGVVIVRATDSDAAALTLEPADANGANPFTDSVAAGGTAVNPAAQTAVAATRASFTTDPNTGALIAPANAPGLYGGSGDTKVCNPQQLVEFLAHDQAKAKAWADVFDITPNDISAYVASLTPVLLTSDTRVTNHGYKNNHATGYQAVLEAGTAVLADTNGIPRVKCNCGNPLTEPTAISVTTTKLNGTQWRTYTPDRIVVIQQNTQITTFVLVNIQTGTTYNVTAPPPPTLQTGTTNTTTNQQATGVWVATYDTPSSNAASNGGSVIVTSPDGETWTKVATVDGINFTALQYGGGIWIGVEADPNANASKIYESTDLSHWTAIQDGASGGDLVVSGSLSDVAFGNGRWVAVGTTVPGRGEYPVAYTSTDGVRWSDDLIDDTIGSALVSVAFGNGSWTAVGADSSAGLVNATIITYGSTDGSTWAPQGRPLETGGLGASGGSVSVDFHDTFTLAFSPGAGTQLFEATDGHSWTKVSDFDEDRVQAITAGVAGFLGISNDRTGSSSTIYASPDGTSWTQVGRLDAAVTAMTFGPTDTATNTSGPP